MSSIIRKILTAALLLTGCGGAAAPADGSRYKAHFSASFTKTSNQAKATITIEQHDGAVRNLDFNAPNSAYQVSAFDGTVTHTDDRMQWAPPKKGGSLSYTYTIDRKRGDAYDAKHTEDWVLLRLDNLFPSARARTSRGAFSDSDIELTGPAGWSFESRYGKLNQGARDLPPGEQRFTRPTGWLIGGILGTRRDYIGDRRVTVSAPVGSGVRRMDTLTFLNWTLPTLTSVLPSLPETILLVGAPHQMWRGGLSGPSSLFLHVDRPLVSENGTSTLLHELVHMAGIHSSATGADWIVEGLAEYYALLVLLRSEGITAERFADTLTGLAEWVERDNGALTDPSKGVDTAAAVLVLHDLAIELQQANSNIDELLARLLEAPEISSQALQDIARGLLGQPSVVLSGRD